MLYWDDVSDSFDGWMNLLRQLGGDSFINFEQDIWETARTYETVPHFGNLRQHHLLERLQDTIRNRWPFLRTGFLINALDKNPLSDVLRCPEKNAGWPSENKSVWRTLSFHRRRKNPLCGC